MSGSPGYVGYIPSADVVYPADPSTWLSRPRVPAEDSRLYHAAGSGMRGDVLGAIPLAARDRAGGPTWRSVRGGETRRESVLLYAVCRACFVCSDAKAVATGDAPWGSPQGVIRDERFVFIRRSEGIEVYRVLCEMYRIINLRRCRKPREVSGRRGDLPGVARRAPLPSSRPISSRSFSFLGPFALRHSRLQSKIRSTAFVELTTRR
jgi:hypothetical protein